MPLFTRGAKILGQRVFALACMPNVINLCTYTNLLYYFRCWHFDIRLGYGLGLMLTVG